MSAALNAAGAPLTTQGLADAYSTNAAVKTILDTFGNAPESIALYGSGSTVSFVNYIFTYVLNRSPAPDGLLFWSGKIDDGSMTRAQAALNIMAGAEANTTAQGQIDAARLANVITVATDFTNHMDTTPEILGYAGSAAAATARSMLLTVTNTTDTKAFLTTVDNTIATITASGGAPGKTYTLTAGVDQITGGAGNDTFNAAPFVKADGTTVPTLTALDSIDGGAGVNTLNVTDTTAALALPASATVKNIQTANISAAGTLNGDVSGWTGLTTLTASEAGGSGAGNLTAAATTNVTLTDTAAAAATVSVQGGNAVAVTANGVTNAGTINVGTATAATGAVTVTENMLATQTGVKTADAINVTGGKSDTVTANLNEQAGMGNTVTGGKITVTGNSATTTVTVNQTAAAAAAAQVAAATGVVGVGATAAAPGVNGVSAVTAVAAAKAAAAVAGVVDGQVVVADANYNTGNANTITTVSLSNYGDGVNASSISSDALSTLALAGTAAALTLNRAATAANATLGLTLNGLSAPTYGGGVVTSATGGNNTITDTNTEITTLNVTTATADSTLTAFADANLTTLNVSGTNVLTLGTVPASIKTLTVTGGAGFAGDISGTAVTSFAPTSSGTITATLDASKQAFTGGAGKDVITISVDSKKAITGGSGSNDVIVLNNTAATFNGDVNKNTTTNVKGFEVLGVNTSSSGTFDMTTLPVGLKSIEVMGTGGATSFTKVTAGTALSIDAAPAAGGITYQVADANGAADSLSLTLGTSKTTAGFINTALVLKDANDVGIGTLNVVSNGSTFNTNHTITTLTDNGLSTLNVSGTAGLTITGLNEATTQATSFTINNTETGAAGVVITTLTDANLGSLTFTGTNASQVAQLASLSGKVLTLANTGTGTATVGDLSTGGGGANLTTLNLNGNVALGANVAVAAAAIGATTGVTVSGATDNAHVNINLTGASVNATDSITLGNGNNYITDGSAAGTVNVTVGSGSNLIDVSTGGNNATYAANITLGAHTNTATTFDEVKASVTGGQASGLSATITGAVTGDELVFKDAAQSVLVTLTAAQQNIITADASLTAAINHAFGYTGVAAHDVVAFQWQGNTYVAENVGADTAFTAGTDSVIELVGVHTIASVAAGGAATVSVAS
jgi:hypothetical protein